MATYKCKRPYMYGTGRRKQSVARVHLIPNGSGSITINGRTLDEYFGLETLKLIVRQPLAATETAEKFDVEATVVGGGMTGAETMEAVYHLISQLRSELHSAVRRAQAQHSLEDIS